MATTQFRPNRSPWLITGLMAVLTVLLAGGWLLVSLLVGKVGLSEAVSSASTVEAAVAQAVTRVGVTEDGTKVQVTYATPEYYERTGQAEAGREAGVEKHLIFIVTEENHSRTPDTVLPQLVVDGTPVNLPVRERMLINSEHHRTRMIRFVRFNAQGKPYIPEGARLLELRWPDMRPIHAADHSLVNPLRWELPIVYPTVVERAPLSPAMLLTLIAGLFAALSPCLIQLTLYYLSTLAGVSLAEGEEAAVVRWPVVRTALWFVAGVTIAYTAGGVLAGVVGQYLQQSGVLGQWSRPVAIISGLILIVMGIYTGAQARAPVLCKLPMPRLVGFARTKGGFGSMLMGFAISLGCLQCFGGAIFASLLVYVGTLGSPMLGGLMLFLFSMGLAIPFLVAAFAWERVVPYLTRLERVTPYVALASSTVMILLGALMAADRFHWVSSLILRWFPFLQV